MGWRVPPKLAAGLIYALYRPWCATLRLDEPDLATRDTLFRSGRPVVATLWHNECFTLIALNQQYKLITVASQSRDGEYIARVLEHLGFIVARGSSSRGGVKALLHCVRQMLRDKLVAAITLDGPRGPRHQAKDGAIFLAHRAGAVILPIRAFPEKAFRFKSWDRFELPLPFSRVKIVHAPAYSIDREVLDEAALAEEREKLNRIMRSLEDQA